MRARRLIASAAVLAVAVGAGCGRTPRDDDATTAEGAALAVFGLARAGEPSAEALDRWFAPPRDARERARLVDALAALAPFGELRVVGVDTEDGTGRVAVDLVARIGSEGEASCNVQFETAPGGGLRVRAFSAPGVAWPSDPTSRGSGLTSSSPPDPAGEPR